MGHERPRGMNTTTKKAANSIVGKLTAGILAVAAAATPRPRARPPSRAAALLVIGDTSRPALRPTSSRRSAAGRSSSDYRNGRSSAEGIERLRLRLGPEHAVVVFDPRHERRPRNPEALYGNLSAARGIAGERCMVVAAIPARTTAAWGLRA